jgi:hypothetical protein
MTNKKISALSSSSTPLTGSEIVPINQSSVTDSVSVANLTAGRAVSALSVTSSTIGATTSTNLNLQSNGVTNAILDTNGNLLLGTTSSTAYGNGIVIGPNIGVGAAFSLGHASGIPSGAGYCLFGYNGSGIGSITQNGTTGVLFNITSDYRLKNNPVPITGAKDFVMALQPKTWDWWDGSGEGVGFIAHEFMEVAKYSGHGEKDATKEEEYEVTPAVKDEQGNITTPAVMDTRTVPVYQSIQPSSSEVIANLVAYIQELSAKVTALESKLGV